MNELSLFSGAGGGLLGTRLLGWKTLGYVEFNDYCQRVLKARIEDGILDQAPIFGDIKAFISAGYAEAYQGFVDVVTAGFPCQPFSVAGKQAGEDDPRNMWPETIECLRIVRPRYAFLENVPNILANPYIGTIFRDLAESGYDANWMVLGGYVADSCCEGERLWIVASETGGAKLESMDFYETVFACKEEPCRRQRVRAIGEMLSQDDYTEFKRNNDDVAEGMDRFKAIGNGQIPRVAAEAWTLLNSI